MELNIPPWLMVEINNCPHCKEIENDPDDSDFWCDEHYQKVMDYNKKINRKR